MEEGNRRFELTVGVFQVVLLLGLVLGSMVASFYLGLVAGQRAGLENALESSQSSAARLPIRIAQGDTATTQNNQKASSPSDLLARLGGEVSVSPPLPRADSLTKASDDLPALVPPPATRQVEASVSPPAAPQGLEPLGSLDTSRVTAKTDPEPGATVVRVLGDPSRRALEVERAARFDSSNVDSVLSRVRERGEETLRNLRDSERGLNVASESTLSDKNAKVIAPPPAAHIAVVPVIEPPASTESVVPARSRDSGGSTPTLPAPATQADRLSPTSVSQESAVPTPVPAPKLTESPLNKGWYAQVLAPRVEGEAKALVTKLRESGFPARVEHAEVRGQQYYRVLVGPEAARTHAQELLQQLKREPYIQGDPFLRLVR